MYLLFRLTEPIPFKLLTEDRAENLKKRKICHEYIHLVEDNSVINLIKKILFFFFLCEES